MKSAMFYIPSNKTRDAVAWFCRLYEGCTVHNTAQGFWVDPKGQVHQETVSLIECADTADVGFWVMAANLASHLDEQAVYWRELGRCGIETASDQVGHA